MYCASTLSIGCCCCGWAAPLSSFWVGVLAICAYLSCERGKPGNAPAESPPVSLRLASTSTGSKQDRLKGARPIVRGRSRANRPACVHRFTDRELVRIKVDHPVARRLAARLPTVCAKSRYHGRARYEEPPDTFANRRDEQEQPDGVGARNPASSSSTPAARIIAPLPSSRPGSAPASSCDRMRDSTPKPCIAAGRARHGGCEHQLDRRQHANLLPTRIKTEISAGGRQEGERAVFAMAWLTPAPR